MELSCGYLSDSCSRQHASQKCIYNVSSMNEQPKGTSLPDNTHYDDSQPISIKQCCIKTII